MKNGLALQLVAGEFVQSDLLLLSCAKRGAEECFDAGGDDKVVYGAANWSAKGKDKDGKPATLSGIATHVFERQPDNSLKLRLQTFN